MMVILGALVNGIFILIGTLFGRLLSSIPESMKGRLCMQLVWPSWYSVYKWD